MTARQPLVVEEPPRFCKLWESESLAAISRALRAQAAAQPLHQRPVSGKRRAAEERDEPAPAARKRQRPAQPEEQPAAIAAAGATASPQAQDESHHAAVAKHTQGKHAPSVLSKPVQEPAGAINASTAAQVSALQPQQKQPIQQEPRQEQQQQQQRNQQSQQQHGRQQSQQQQLPNQSRSIGHAEQQQDRLAELHTCVAALQPLNVSNPSMMDANAADHSAAATLQELRATLALRVAAAVDKAASSSRRLATAQDSGGLASSSSSSNNDAFPSAQPSTCGAFASIATAIKFQQLKLWQQTSQVNADVAAQAELALSSNTLASTSASADQQGHSQSRQHSTAQQGSQPAPGFEQWYCSKFMDAHATDLAAMQAGAGGTGGGHAAPVSKDLLLFAMRAFAGAVPPAMQPSMMGRSL